MAYPGTMSSLALATVHVTAAGEGSATPACVARTSKVCSPSARLSYPFTRGSDGQVAKTSLSRRHSNTAPSGAEYRNIARDEYDVGGGDAVILVSGGCDWAEAA